MGGGKVADVCWFTRFIDQLNPLLVACTLLEQIGHHTWDDSTDAAGAVLACCWGGGGLCVIMELAKVEGEGGRLQMMVVV